MEQEPDIILIVDQKCEITAIKEAISLNIPIISILDTNCDPDLATIPIPGNDDAIRSIKYIVQKLADSIALGKQNKTRLIKVVIKLKNKKEKIMNLEISSKLVKELREKTGAGMMNCKKALQENKGDFEKAVESLRQKGLASADKKAGRTSK